MRYSTDPMGFVAILILFGSILCHGVSPGGLPPGTLTFLWSRLLVYPRGLGECMHICAGSQTRTCTLSVQVLPGFGLMVLPTCTSLHLMVLYKYPYIHEERASSGGSNKERSRSRALLVFHGESLHLARHGTSTASRTNGCPDEWSNYSWPHVWPVPPLFARTGIPTHQPVGGGCATGEVDQGPV